MNREKLKYNHALVTELSSTESDNLVSLIEKIKLKTRDITNNKGNSVFGEKISLDRLIVMDNVSVLLIIVKNLQNF